MAFRITAVERRAFPSDGVVEEAFGRFGLSARAIEQLLGRFVCEVPRIDGRGYQQDLSTELERYLGRQLSAEGKLHNVYPRYHPKLNEKGDVAFSRVG